MGGGRASWCFLLLLALPWPILLGLAFAISGSAMESAPVAAAVGAVAFLALGGYTKALGSVGARLVHRPRPTSWVWRYDYGARSGWEKDRDRFQARINDEYTDISSRISWLLAGQAFLAAVFVAIYDAGGFSCGARRWLAVLAALSGAVGAAVLTVSVVLGHAIIDDLKRSRDDLEE